MNVIFKCALASAAMLTVALAATAQSDLYKAVIQKDGRVRLNFNRAVCDRMARAMFDQEPRNPTSAVVMGTSGRIVELLKTRFGPDWNPVLLMRNSAGRVFVLNVQEAVKDGDMTCGMVYGVSGARTLKEVKRNGGRHVEWQAVLKNGKSVTFVGSDTDSGRYAVEGYDAVIHITRDYGISIENKAGKTLASGTWHQSFGGSGMTVLSCNFNGTAVEVEKYDGEDSDELCPEFKIFWNNVPEDFPLPTDVKFKTKEIN